MSVPSWKMAILARRKQQEDEERRKKAELDAYLASLPPWKRALKQKQKEKEAKGDAQNPPVSLTEPAPAHTLSKPPALSKWKEVEEKSKVVDTLQPHPGLSPKQSFRLSGSKPSALSRWKQVEEKAMTAEASETHSDSAVASIHRHGSLKPLALSKWKGPEPHPEGDGAQAISQAASPGLPRRRTEPAEHNDSSANSTAASSQDVEAGPAHEIFRQPSFLDQPKWKQDLILRKRGIKRPSAEESRKKPTSNSPAVAQLASVKPPQEPVTKVEVDNTSKNIPESSKPEKPVGVPEKEVSVPEKLVSVEGKLYRPPIFKEVDEWANVDDLESNRKFKNLPLWHQALIKRKRDKRVMRSQPKESAAKTSQAKDMEDRPEVSTPWSRHLTSITSTTEPDNQSKTAPNEDFQTVSSSKPAEKETSEIPSWLAQVRARKQHSQQANKPSQPPQHTPEPVVTISTTPSQTTSTVTKPQKSSPPSNTPSLVRSPSDLSDAASDLECTLIDELSDEEEDQERNLMSSSGLESQETDVRPILKTIPGKKGLRKVSFSDSQLTTEHVYPKYTYDDYDEIEQPGSPDGLATPVHPWLSTTPSSAKQPTKTLETNYLSSFSNTTFDSVLAAYAFNRPPASPTRDVSSPTGSTTGSRSSSTGSLTANADVYNLSTDAAALIW